MKSFLSLSRKELMSDFDIPRLTIPQLCYYARFDKFLKSRSALRFARVIHNFVDPDVLQLSSSKTCYSMSSLRGTTRWSYLNKITRLFLDLSA